MTYFYWYLGIGFIALLVVFMAYRFHLRPEKDFIKIRDMFRTEKQKTWHYKLRDKVLEPLLGAVLMLCVWPGALFWVAKDIISRNKVESESEGMHLVPHEELTFSSMGGVGILSCIECKHSEKVLSFIHGRGCESGYQCLSCGKFARISDEIECAVNAGEIKCDCGGNLSRDHELFCPNCQSKKLTYDVVYLT